MTQLHAQPYDQSATGFYLEEVEEFYAKANTNRNGYGPIVEVLPFRRQHVVGEQTAVEPFDGFKADKAALFSSL
jgi:hypothetical protein